MPPPLPPDPKKWTWRKNGGRVLVVFAVIASYRIFRGYHESGFVEPVEWAALGIGFVVLVGVVSFAGWLINKAK